MSVNIFGSSGRQSSKIDNTYVDQKFTTLATNLNSKMDESGGNFTGDIHMADKNITISHTPMSANDVANKKYVDTAVNNHVLLTVKPDSVTGLNSKVNESGDLIMGSNKVSSSHVHTADFDVINKKYFDELIARRLNDDDMKIIENRLSLKLNLAGDEMRGAIRMGDHKITSNRVPEEDAE